MLLTPFASDFNVWCIFVSGLFFSVTFIINKNVIQLELMGNMMVLLKDTHPRGKYCCSQLYVLVFLAVNSLHI